MFVGKEYVLVSHHVSVGVRALELVNESLEEGTLIRISVVVVSGMQLLRLRTAIRRHHPPQRAVLSQICCFGERKVVLFQILLDSAEPRDAGTT